MGREYGWGPCLLHLGLPPCDLGPARRYLTHLTAHTARVGVCSVWCTARCRGAKYTSHLQRPSRPLAAEPSRLPLRHRPCLSGRRQPSSLGASANGSGSARSTSPGWRECAHSCRRGCAAPEPASRSLWSSRRQQHRQDRRWPCPSRAQSCRLSRRRCKPKARGLPRCRLPTTPSPGWPPTRASPSRSSAGSTTPRTTPLRPNHQLSRQRQLSPRRRPSRPPPW